MKITASRTELSRILANTMAVMESKVSINVLGYVKLQFKAGIATLSGLSLGMSSVSKLSLASGDEGTILLKADQLKRQLNVMNGDTVTFTQEDSGAVTMKSGKANLKVPSLPTAEFPAIEEAPASTVTLSLPALKTLIAKVESAVPDKEAKYSIPVILLEGKADRLRAVATDGHRVVVADADGTFPTVRLLLQKFGLAVIKNLDGENATFSETDTNYFFRTASNVFGMRKSQATFPPYERALAPATFNTTVEVSSEELKRAVELTSTVQDAAKPGVNFISEGASNQELYLTALSSEHGDAQDSFTTVKTEGSDIKVRLNPDYVQDFLGKTEGNVKVEFISPIKLVRFTAGANFTYLIMPTNPEETAAAAPAKA